MERRRKNARARERYRERRLTESARVNNRTGMHALAIQVDPAAYRAVKAEALQRGSSIPTVIGEILSDSSRQPIASEKTTEPRWRRTGEGRKANQHTRIDIDDEGWLTVRHDAIRHGLTIARWIGLTLETWASRLELLDPPPSPPLPPPPPSRPPRDISSGAAEKGHHHLTRPA